MSEETDASKAERIERVAQSLELDPADWETFEGVLHLLEKKQDWATQERACRKMLQRLTADITVQNRQRELPLWRRLVVLYRDRLKDLSAAITTGEYIAEAWPREVPAQMELAALYEKASQFDAAEYRYERAVHLQGNHPAATRKLYDLRLEHGPFDGAFCAAAVLAALGEFDVQDFYRLHAPKTLRFSGKRLDPLAWSLLRSRGEDQAMSDVFLFLAAPAIRIARENHGSSAPLDPCFTPAAIHNPKFRSVFAWATKTLGLPIQRHIADREDPAREPPPLENGASLDEMHDGLTLKQLLFIAGRQAAYHRPFCLLRSRYPEKAGTEVLFLAGCELVGLTPEVPPVLRVPVTAMVLSLRRVVTKDELAGLSAATKRLPPNVNVGLWRESLELTASRTGLLLAGDLEVAKNSLGSETETHAHADLPQFVLQLRLLQGFAVERAHIALRKELGFDVQVDLSRGPKLFS